MSAGRSESAGLRGAESAGVQRVQGCRAHDCRGGSESAGGAEAQGSRGPWLPLVAPSNC